VNKSVQTHPEFDALRAGLDATTLRDRRALSRALDRLTQREVVAPEALIDWKRRLQQAHARYAARAASLPEIRVA
jgi:hypothetical protein